MKTPVLFQLRAESIGGQLGDTFTQWYAGFDGEDQLYKTAKRPRHSELLRAATARPLNKTLTRYERQPERFVRGRPVVSLPPSSVAIDPIMAHALTVDVVDRVNFPTLAAAGHVKYGLSSNMPPKTG